MTSVLIVGYGSIGKKHLENFLQFKDIQLTVYTKRNDLQLLKKKGIKVSSSLTECLKENQDVGVVTNETSLHIPIAIKLAKEGLDLFLEKPLSNSLKDVEKLRTIIKKKKLITQMGCNLRFHPCIKKIKSMIEQQKIGKTLSDLDTKIQNLQNQNKILEQIAQNIFKSWFIDFDDVEEEQPEIDADVSTDKGDEIGSEEGADEPVAEEPAGDSSGGIMDITAEDSETADAGVDFDIGGMEAPADESPDEVSLEVPADDNALEFDAGGMNAETESSDGDADLASGDDNIIDFDTGSDDEDLGIELDAGEDIASDDGGGVELDLSMDDEDGESLEVPGEINIDELEASPDEGLEIDLSIDDDADSDDALDANNLELDTGDDDESDDNDAIALDNDLDMDLDLEIQEDNADVPEIDMEGTVEMPKLDVGDMGIEIDDDDDDDDDHTVFVPRASAADEQTAEDEIATKLDLAKAYVELGDKDSAKGILDEVLADGNEEQKQAAQELISQLD